MDNRKCPLCGTPGKIWHKSPETWKCPNCSSIFSEFGMVVEAEADLTNMWS